MLNKIRQQNLSGGSRLHTLLFSLLLSIPLGFTAWHYLEIPISSVLILSLIIGYVFIGNLHYVKDLSLRAIYVVAGIVKWILLIVMAHFKPGFLSGVDWANFHRYALDTIGSSHSLFGLYNNSLDFFVFVMSVIYKVFGPYPDQMYLLIFACSLLVFRFVYKTVILIGGSERLAAFSGILIMLWPVNIIYSTTLVREVPIQLVVAASFYFFVKHLKSNRNIDMVWACVLAVFAALIHSGMIALLAVYFYVYAQGGAKQRKRMFSLKALIGTFVLMTILLISPLGAGVTSRFADLNSIDTVNQQYEFQLEASTTYIESTASSFGDFVLTAPYRFVMFALSPLPWQVNSFETLISWIMDGLIQLMVVFLLYRAWRRSRNADSFLRNIIVSGLLGIVAIYAVFAMGTNNYGSAMRHRTKVLPVVVVVLAASTVSRRQLKAEHRLKEQ